MNYEIPFLRPTLVFKENYYKYLEEIDDSHIYSNFGPLNCRLEERILRGYFDQKGAVTTVSNGTTGLILAIEESRRPDARYALMPSFTFAATPLAAIWCGLEPYFVDVDVNNWCMDESCLREAIEKLGDDVAVIIPYSTFGTALNLEFYSEIHQSGVPVVVDAAPCFGTRLNDSYFGIDFPGTLVFSFHATKAFGVGEGGLVYSAEPKKIQSIRQSSNFGFSESKETTKLGLNGKMSEYTAAIALATLETYPEKVKKRRDIYAIYKYFFTEYSLFDKGWNFQETNGEIPYQFTPVACPDNTINSEIVEKLDTLGIQARMYFNPPCHQQTKFKPCKRGDLNVTDRLSERVLSLPLWEGMNDVLVEKVVKSLM